MYVLLPSEPGKLSIYSSGPGHAEFKTGWLNPMDLVLYCYLDDNNKGPLPLLEDMITKGLAFPIPAIQIRYMIDRSNYEQNSKTARAAGDVIGLILSLLFPATAAAARLLRLADIALATTDLVYLKLTADDKDYLMKVDGVAGGSGSWFVENWNTIYTVAALGMIGPQLAGGIINNGRKLLTVLTDGPGTKIAAKIKKLIELAEKVKKRTGTLISKVIPTLSKEDKLFCSVFGVKKVTPDIVKLKDAGVSLRASETADEISVISDGAEVFKDTKEKVQAQLARLLEQSPSKLRRTLASLVSKTRIPFALTSGAKITERLQAGTALIGGYLPDTKAILEYLQYTKIDTTKVLRADYIFEIPIAQKFQLLDVAQPIFELAKESGGFFKLVNAKWIDYLVKTKVEILIVSKPCGYKRS